MNADAGWLKKNRRMAWIAGAAMTTVLYFIVFAFMDVRFAINDDTSIMRSFMGYESGVPAAFHIYIHGLLAKPLAFLSRLFPLTPWFSWMQHILMALSFIVISKSIMQCFVNRGRPLWLGMLFAALFLLAFGLEYATVFTFTQTAAFLGAAAVTQLLSIPCQTDDRNTIAGIGAAAVLAACAYAMRQSALLPVIAFCGLAFVFAAWERYAACKSFIRPMALGLCLTLVLLGGMIAGREWEMRHSNAQEYLNWQEANSYIIDYYGLGTLTQEDADQVGWSSNTLAMARSWCFLDQELNAETFNKLTEIVKAKEKPPLIEQLKQAKSLYLRRARSAEYEHRMLGVAALAFIVSLIGSVFQPQKCLRLLFTLGALALGSAVMIIYLAMQGRIPLRAVLTIALPAAAMLLALLPACIPPKRFAVPALSILAAVSVLFALSNLLPIQPLLLRSVRGVSGMNTAFAQLEKYALSHPDQLILYNNTIVSSDVGAFPDYSDGVPRNLSAWGNWSLRSPENEQLFKRYGIDIWRFDPAVLLREDVLFAVSGQPDPGAMLDWLREKISPDVQCSVFGQHESVWLLQFTAADR